MSGKRQDGNEAFDEIASKPNLDLWYDRNPSTLTDDDIHLRIEVERQERALFIEKKGK